MICTTFFATNPKKLSGFIKFIYFFTFGSTNFTGLFAQYTYGLKDGYFEAIGSTLQNLPMRLSCMRYSKACRAISPSTSLSASCPLKKYRYPPHSGMREFLRVCGGVVYGVHGAKIGVRTCFE